MKKITSWVFIIALLFYMTTEAYAVPVGSFNWEADYFYGPTFSIENCSPAGLPPNPCTESSPLVSFFDVFVDLNIITEIGENQILRLGSGLDPVDTGLVYQIGTLDNNNPTFQSPEYLGSYNIISATLGLNIFEPNGRAGIFTLRDENGNILQGLTNDNLYAVIDYEPSGGQVPVPEPGTHILLGMGLAVLTILGRMRNTYCKVMKRT